jgi:glycosyltransferase involved in cell wall biosynthesis
MVRSCHFPSRIRIEPVTSDAYRFFTIADFFVSASDLESLPRTFMEAMAFEVPIVAADVFGVPDLVEDTISGWLTRPRDLEGLVGLLHAVLTKSSEEVSAVTAAARAAAVSRSEGPRYGEFYVDALTALSECPEADLNGVWKGWNERKSGGG